METILISIACLIVGWCTRAKVEEWRRDDHAQPLVPWVRPADIVQHKDDPALDVAAPNPTGVECMTGIDTTDFTAGEAVAKFQRTAADNERERIATWFETKFPPGKIQPCSGGYLARLVRKSVPE